jgi:RNA polymerase sigma-70 factor (ECF subfamily)
MDEFGTLIEQEIPRLRRYARALTRDASSADDLVQDCLARALAKSDLWQPGTNLRAWLFTILHNQHVNKVRRGMREGISIPVEDAEASLIAGPSQGQSLAIRDLQRGLAQLPDEQRTVILLIGLEGLRYEEAAQILDVPVGTVRSRLSRGRDALRMLMGMTEAAEEVVDRAAYTSPELFSIAAYLAKRNQAVAANARRRTGSHLDGLSASA